jgi:hypothetical protein
MSAIFALTKETAADKALQLGANGNVQEQRLSA